MQGTAKVNASDRSAALFGRIRDILLSARVATGRSVNSAQVICNWLIGREIVEDEQRGERRAGYSERTLKRLAERLQREFGSGYSESSLKAVRKFFLVYPALIQPSQIGHPLGAQFHNSMINGDKSGFALGQLCPSLSWRHYRFLMRIDSSHARAFYEIEAVKNSWSARELERQVASLLFERLARSRDKEKLMKLAAEGQFVEKPSDVFKDPVVMEFLGLPETPALTESSLESALLSNLQAFLLELGSGFAFVARQQRITLDGDHFYIDLVFYHAVLKCFVLLDLKVGKLTHADLGQLQLYVNFYDLERRAPDDNPTLGLILCSDKNDTVVKYTLGPNQEEKIFASRYKLHLPSEADLQARLRTRRRLSLE
jgi:predicted nuclease of restriction endonuclease-like (RecB) superfamily